jgi:hypothetical protein
MTQPEPQIEIPMPGLEPKIFNADQFMMLRPRKIELIHGWVIGPPPYYDEVRHDLLLMLLANWGLKEAVRLAPPEAWRAALREVYGDAASS